MNAPKARIKAVNKCITKTHKPLLVLKGRKKEKSQLTFKNKNRNLLVKVELDGCYAKDTTEKCCDYLVQHNGINYYIELKGVNYADAFPQIISAITQFNKDFDGNICKAIIVASKSPTVTDAQKAFRRSKLKGLICGEPIIKSTPYKHPLS